LKHFIGQLNIVGQKLIKLVFIEFYDAWLVFAIINIGIQVVRLCQHFANELPAGELRHENSLLIEVYRSIDQHVEIVVDFFIQDQVLPFLNCISSLISARYESVIPEMPSSRSIF
jgi:hypothetical protein